MTNNDDVLKEMWEMQRALNNYTLKSNGFPYSFDDVSKDKKLQEEWVKNYTLAMRQECAELFDSTNWKWWRTKVDLLDEQNVKVELIDTWNMNITPVKTVFQVERLDRYKFIDKKKRTVEFPDKPYMAMRITRIE